MIFMPNSKESAHALLISTLEILSLLFEKEFREGTYPANLLGGIKAIQKFFLCCLRKNFVKVYPCDVAGLPYRGTYPANPLGGIKAIQRY